MLCSGLGANIKKKSFFLVAGPLKINDIFLLFSLERAENQRYHPPPLKKLKIKYVMFWIGSKIKKSSYKKNLFSLDYMSKKSCPLQ